MASDNSQTELTWTASEYVDHYRGANWYLMLAVVTAALAVLCFYIFKDVFESVVMVILGLVVAISARHKPRLLTYALTTKGIHIGEKFYAYTNFRSFAIQQEGAFKSLVLVPIKRFMPPISVFFESVDEENIVETINHHLPIENRQPDRIDSLTKLLKF